MRMFKAILATLAATIALAAHGTTYVPVPLLNPTGSTAGQAVVSTGPSSAATWGGVGLNGIASIAANTVVANATASSAAPTAFAMPSCSTSSSALNYTTNTGFGCNTSINATTLGGTAAASYALLASPTFTGTVTIPSGASISGYLTTASAASTYAPLASPTFTGTTTVANLTATGTLTGVHGRLINVQVFTSSGTYTPTSGANSIIVEVQAPGGGSGGNPATSTGQNSVSGAGGGGAYARVYFTSASSQTVTIGAVGAAGAAGANVGGAGGTTSFGSLISCPGGLGGTAGSVETGAGEWAAASGFASACTISGGTAIVSSTGGQGSQGVIFVLASTLSGGVGGPAMLGQSPTSSYNGGPASAGRGYGAGASGGRSLASASAIAGSTGAPAIIIVYEFS